MLRAMTEQGVIKRNDFSRNGPSIYPTRKKRNLQVVYRFATPHFELLSNAAMSSVVFFTTC